MDENKKDYGPISNDDPDDAYGAFARKKSQRLIDESRAKWSKPDHITRITKSPGQEDKDNG